MQPVIITIDCLNFCFCLIKSQLECSLKIQNSSSLCKDKKENFVPGSKMFSLHFKSF